MMKKFKLSCWYAILTIYLPITILTLSFILAFYGERYLENHNGWNLIPVLRLLEGWANYASYPISINIVLGPSILAFWGHKKSRVIILILNLIDLGLIWSTANGLLFGAIPFLYCWVLQGETTEKSEALSKYGFYWIPLVLLSVIIAIIACFQYKTPERKMAEEILNYRTIKWDHDGKTEILHVR